MKRQAVFVATTFRIELRIIWPLSTFHVNGCTENFPPASLRTKSSSASSNSARFDWWWLERLSEPCYASTFMSASTFFSWRSFFAARQQCLRTTWRGPSISLSLSLALLLWFVFSPQTAIVEFSGRWFSPRYGALNDWCRSTSHVWRSAHLLDGGMDGLRDSNVSEGNFAVADGNR